MAAVKDLAILGFWCLLLILVGAGLGAGFGVVFGHPAYGLIRGLIGGGTLGFFAGLTGLAYFWGDQAHHRMYGFVLLAALLAGRVVVPPPVTDGESRRRPLSLLGLTAILAATFTAFFLGLNIDLAKRDEAIFIIFPITMFGVLAGVFLALALDRLVGTEPDRQRLGIWIVLGSCLVLNGVGYALIKRSQQRTIAALVRELSEPAPSTRFQAVKRLGDVTTAPERVVTPLLESLSDPELRRESAESLRKVGTRLVEYGRKPDAIRALIGSLHDGSVTHAVVGQLRQLGPPAATALEEALTDPDPQVRREAAVALGGFGETGRSAVPSLQNALRDPEAAVRRESAIALTRIAPENAAPIPVLQQALNDREAYIREDATEALGQLRPQADTVAPLLEQVMRNKERAQRDRWSAACALIELDRARPNEVVPLLIEALSPFHFSPSGFEYEAVEALGKLGPVAREAVPALQRTATARDYRLQYAIEQALEKITPQ